MQATKLSEKADRVKLYEEMQKIITDEEAPWLNIAHSTVFEPVRKEVSGYKISPLGAPRIPRRRHRRVVMIVAFSVARRGRRLAHDRNPPSHDLLPRIARRCQQAPCSDFFSGGWRSRCRLSSP